MGAGGDEDENGNPPVPETSPDSIRSLAKYASRKAEAEAEVEAEDKFRNMRVGGGLTEEPSDDEVRHVNYDTRNTSKYECGCLMPEADSSCIVYIVVSHACRALPTFEMPLSSARRRRRRRRRHAPPRILGLRGRRPKRRAGRNPVRGLELRHHNTPRRTPPDFFLEY